MLGKLEIPGEVSEFPFNKSLSPHPTEPLGQSVSSRTALMAFLAFLPPADFSELKKQMGREQKGQDAWHLKKDLTSNDGLLDERQRPL